MSSEQLKGLVGDIVFYLTGILCGCILIYTEKLEKAGQYLVSVIYVLCDLTAFFCKGDVVVRVDLDQVIVLHFLEYDRHGRTGIS